MDWTVNWYIKNIFHTNWIGGGFITPSIFLLFGSIPKYSKVFTGIDLLSFGKKKIILLIQAILITELKGEPHGLIG